MPAAQHAAPLQDCDQMCTHHIIDRGPFLYITQCTLCRRKPCVQKRLSQRRERGEMAAVSLPLTEDELLGTVNDILQRRATCHIQDCHAGLIRPETVVLAVNFVAAAAAAARVLANPLIERLTAPEQLSSCRTTRCVMCSTACRLTRRTRLCRDQTWSGHLV